MMITIFTMSPASLLTNFSFMGSTLTMLHAYSANEARAILERNPDIAVGLA